MPQRRTTTPPARARDDAPRYRSGAVARMVRMPVATLRIWQRRYRVAEPALTASGQRLYSADDVRRLALLKQLTDLGHAIGTLAPLTWAQLQGVAATHASAVSGQAARAHDDGVAAPCRLAVVGDGLAQRLQRPGLRRAFGHPLHVTHALAQRTAAAAALKAAPADLLLIEEARPDAVALAAWLARLRKVHAGPVAMLYRFAPEPVCEALAAAGVALLREPQSDSALGQWLASLTRAGSAVATAARPAQPRPRRWDDAQLSGFAGLSSTIACECPRHVAELVMQLSHFEAYSADCSHRDPADAALHDYLRGVASASRALFEDALERVAVHEGLLLPA